MPEAIQLQHNSINRFVISEGVLQCLELIGASHRKGSKLFAYNTDRIYITNLALKLKNKVGLKFKAKMIGKAFVTDPAPVYFEKHFRKGITIKDYEVEKGDSKIFNGQARSDKTYKLCKMVANEDKPLILAFTNKAVENVKKKLPMKLQVCFTFDSYFFERNRSVKNF